MTARLFVILLLARGEHQWWPICVGERRSCEWQRVLPIQQRIAVRSDASPLRVLGTTLNTDSTVSNVSGFVWWCRSAALPCVTQRDAAIEDRVYGVVVMAIGDEVAQALELNACSGVACAAAGST